MCTFRSRGSDTGAYRHTAYKEWKIPYPLCSKIIIYNSFDDSERAGWLDEYVGDCAGCASSCRHIYHPARITISAESSGVICLRCFRDSMRSGTRCGSNTGCDGHTVNEKRKALNAQSAPTYHFCDSEGASGRCDANFYTGCGYRLAVIAGRSLMID